jgi:hypothetical protein
MLKTCQGPECGVQFETTSARAKFCGSTCRSRAHRNGESVAEIPPAAPSGDPQAVPPLLEATRRELEKAGVADSPLGQQALELARRMSDPRAMGLSVAPISKELRTVMSEALKDAAVASGLDELRLRRDRKRNAG